MAMALACDVCGTTKEAAKHFLQWNDDDAWSVDLCPKHAHELLLSIEGLMPYAIHTTPRSARAARRATTGLAPYDAATGVDIAEVRAWALQKGIPVSERGRVAGDVIEKWKKAHRKR
jgi:hypothetical protein